MENQYSSYFFYLAILVLFPLTLFRYFFHGRRNLPPSPLSLPIIGHLYLLKTTLYLTLTSLSAKYGPVLYLKLGCMPVIIVSSPSAVEECLTKNDITFANRPKTLAGDKFTFNYTVYVWAPYGQLWRILRRLTVVELFSSHSLHKTSTLRNQEVGIFIRSLYKFSKSSTKVDLTNWAFTLVFNLMSKIIAGKHVVNEEDAGREKGIEIIDKLRETFLVTISFLNMCDFLPMLRWIGYKGLEKKMALIHNKRNEFLNSLLDEFRQKKISGLESNTPIGNREKKTTLIETLLSFQESEPEFYTDDIIKSIMLVVFVAGTETSSSTIQWVMRLLLAHPEALHKLRADIDSKVGNKRLLNESDLTKLPYLRCVINETMRLYPPVPLLLPHYSTEDCTVGGYDVPKHTMLLVNAWAVHRDPKVWEDPEKFKPERFEATEGETERFNYKLVPFGMGRRACPGADMGLRAVSLALGALIQCFDWKIEEEQSLEASYNARVSMENKPLKAVCTPRQDLVQLLSQL
ncbi:hypothetical protein HAX54_025838 [Datura stramonium]|uniref:Cytochrome P450 n=1 Tax=Datura stramonium TaxID=4076 RepID=A0ABS8S7R0_DATST|nr:hypothetical protein [Datura stramonium]